MMKHCSGFSFIQCMIKGICFIHNMQRDMPNVSCILEISPHSLRKDFSFTLPASGVRRGLAAGWVAPVEAREGGWGLRIIRGWDLKQFLQIFPAQTCLVKNINKCSLAAFLPDFNESCLFKCSDKFFPGNNWQFRHGLLQLWSKAAWISHEADLLRSFQYKAQ